MKEKKCFLLGLPLSSLTMEAMVAKIFEETDKERSSPSALYVGTVKPYFFSHLFSWPTNRSRYPELLGILRNAKLLPPNSLLILWLCRLFGSTIEESISDSELVQRILKTAPERDKKIFLLAPKTSHDPEEPKKAPERPDLQPLKICHASLFTTTGHLLYAKDQDQLVLEQIERQKPDLLLIELGSPPQEIWYERVKKNLPASVSVGIDENLPPEDLSESFAFFMKTPGMLARRYFWNCLKIPFLTVPLLLYYWGNFGWYQLTKKKEPEPQRRSLLFLSKQTSLAVIPLPEAITEENYTSLESQIEEALSQDVIALDFHAVKQVDLFGMGLLFSAWKTAKARCHPMFAFRVPAQIKLLFQLNHLWDYCNRHVCRNSEEILHRLCKEDHTLFHAIEQRGNEIVLFFLGNLDNSAEYTEYSKTLSPMLKQKNCLMDFSYCHSIDNTGIQFLLKLREIVTENGHRFRAANLHREVRIALQIAEVADLFPEA